MMLSDLNEMELCSTQPCQPDNPEASTDGFSKNPKKTKSLLSVSITDQWTDFPQYVKTPKSRYYCPPTWEFDSDGRVRDIPFDKRKKYCICSTPPHKRACPYYDENGKHTKKELVTALEFWEFYLLDNTQRQPKSSGFKSSEDTADTVADRLSDIHLKSEAAASNTPLHHVVDLDSDLEYEVEFYPELHFDFRRPRQQVCQICSEPHHHKKCDWYLAFGRRTKNRFETAIEFYQSFMALVREQSANHEH